VKRLVAAPAALPAPGRVPPQASLAAARTAAPPAAQAGAPASPAGARSGHLPQPLPDASALLDEAFGPEPGQ
jgi:hypothetical protein